MGCPPHVPTGHKEAACDLPLGPAGGMESVPGRGRGPGEALAEHSMVQQGNWGVDKVPAPTLASPAI